MRKLNGQSYVSKDQAIKILGITRKVFENLEIDVDRLEYNPHCQNRPIHLYKTDEISRYRAHPLVIEYHNNINGNK